MALGEARGTDGRDYVTVMPPDAHDALVATVSHLPYLVSLALTHMVARDERLSLLAAGGFRDLTRVASGDPRMSRDMVVENRAALREALARFRRQLERLEADLEQPGELLMAANEGKRTRDSLPVVRRSLLPPKHDLVVAVPDKPGLGIEPDMDRIEAAHALYKQVAGGARDDAMAMRYLVPGWTYHPNKPSLARD